MQRGIRRPLQLLIALLLALYLARTVSELSSSTSAIHPGSTSNSGKGGKSSTRVGGGNAKDRPPADNRGSDLARAPEAVKGDARKAEEKKPNPFQIKLEADGRTMAQEDQSPGEQCPGIKFLREIPTAVDHRPRSIALALDEATTKSGDLKDQTSIEGKNSVKLTKEDVQRGVENMVRPLQTALPRYYGKQLSGGISAGEQAQQDEDQRDPKEGSECLQRSLFNAIKDEMQNTVLDSSPIVADFGCAIGRVLAVQHDKSTVVCALKEHTKLYAPPRLARMTRSGRELDAPLEGFGHSRKSLYPNNLFWIGTKSFVKAPFTQIYESCNLITVAIVMKPEMYMGTEDLAADGREGHTQLAKAMLQHLNLILPAAASTFTLFPAKRIAELEALVARGEDGECPMIGTTSSDSNSGGIGAHRVCIELKKLATVHSVIEDNDEFVLVHLQLEKVHRPCRKTFGAPFKQWDREQSLGFENGRVVFKVVSVSGGGGSKKKSGSGAAEENAAAQSGGGGVVAKKETMRVIHPLQYIPSLNLDTLLGLGLEAHLRQRLLGQMLATPRYSDPLPHNWVLGGGGRLQRIDKVDKRYDSAVDESKGWWGSSTRGYVHLLTYHLCLPLRPNGLPGWLEEDCYPTCKKCVESCSYLPKATEPCTECKSCGLGCVASAFNGTVHAHVVEKCQKTYSSMDSARKVWKKWKQNDEKYPL